MASRGLVLAFISCTENSSAIEMSAEIKMFVILTRVAVSCKEL